MHKDIAFWFNMFKLTYGIELGEYYWYCQSTLVCLLGHDIRCQDLYISFYPYDKGKRLYLLDRREIGSLVWYASISSLIPSLPIASANKPTWFFLLLTLTPLRAFFVLKIIPKMKFSISSIWNLQLISKIVWFSIEPK